MSPRPKLAAIRRLVSTGGAHIRWSKVGSTKWQGNATAGEGMSDAQLVAQFELNGWDVSHVVIDHGDYETCSRCRGRGVYAGGPCFKCYGNRSTLWVSA